MKKILVTGGTVFVSKYVAVYFRDNGYEVYVLNRNTKPQLENVRLIEADRHFIGDKLKNIHFDLVLDVTAYNEADIADFVTALDSFDTYNEYEKEAEFVLMFDDIDQAIKVNSEYRSDDLEYK